MNITFLIGNGFDLNLGLESKYSQFVKFYKGIKSDLEFVNQFKERIDKDEELWSNAEIAIGKDTANFQKGEGEKFSECHIDFCNELSKYLKKEEEKIKYDSFQEKIFSTLIKLDVFYDKFPLQERIKIDNAQIGHRMEDKVFSFINYNYTYTLDKCLTIFKDNKKIIGTHQQGAKVYKHLVGATYHIHGTVDGEMVFGVNDESQIAKPDIFDYEEGNIDKDSLIKIQANAGYMQNTDGIVSSVISNSNIIYIYGMSISPTDKLWWDRLCVWLKTNINNQLIVQKYGLGQKGIIQTQYKKEVMRFKKEIVNYSNLNENDKNNILEQIHVTNENIFEDIKDIAISKSVSEEILEKVIDMDWEHAILKGVDKT